MLLRIELSVRRRTTVGTHMDADSSVRASAFYIYACPNGADDLTPSTVFYEVRDELLAQSLCRLFAAEYSDTDGKPTFHHQTAAGISPEEQVLLDEALDWLYVYDDPDPGIYDPCPPGDMLVRAQYTVRARHWEELLKDQMARSHEKKSDDAEEGGRGLDASDADSPLTDELLLQICRISEDDGKVTPEWLADLRSVPRLVGHTRCKDSHLEHAMTLLTSLLGQLPQYNPTHLPFGYKGPCIQSHDWIERETLERVGKQIVGLIWHEIAPNAVAVTVQQAVSEAIRLGFLEQQEYDAWRPGMASGSGRRPAVTATTYGIAKARALAEKHAGGPARNATEPKVAAAGSACSSRLPDPAYDRAPFDIPELDDYRRLGPLDFATLMDRWDDALEKLSLALLERNAEQIRVLASEYSLEKVSALIRLAMEDRGISCDAIIRLCDLFEREASGFDVEIKKGWLDDAMATTDRLKTKLALELDTPHDQHAQKSFGESNGGGSLKAGGKPETGEGIQIEQDQVPTQRTASNDRYKWARQVELVKATNQVLGERTLNPGVLSRACKEGHIETNGKSGRAARASVNSFLAWVARRCEIAKDEQNQVRNAIIGEICGRNS